MKRRYKTLIGVAALGVAAAVLGPYEKVELVDRFDPSQLSEGVTPYLSTTEALVENIRPGQEKQVVWAGAPEQKTEWAVVYFHGFSASKEEIRPVPDALAEALGANLYLTRFTGHGQDGAAMGQALAVDWLADADEAMAIGRAIGDKVILLSTSTGGSLATLVAADPDLNAQLAALAFVSPNFGVNNPAAPLLTLPGARYWLPALAGKERGFTPHNDEQARVWTTQYPSTAVFPMAAVAKAAWEVDHSQIDLPAVFVFDPDDQVVMSSRTQTVMGNWGGDSSYVAPAKVAGDDPSRHVVAGTILSPGATPEVIDALIAWAQGL